MYMIPLNFLSKFKLKKLPLIIEFLLGNLNIKDIRLLIGLMYAEDRAFDSNCLISLELNTTIFERYEYLFCLLSTIELAKSSEYVYFLDSIILEKAILVYCITQKGVY